MSERNLDRFSQVYLFGGPQTEDSKRFRVRLSGMYYDVSTGRRSANIEFEVAKLIQRECGVQIRHYGEFDCVTELIEKGDMRDVLDTVTLIYRVMLQSRAFEDSILTGWRVQVTRFLREENLSYRIDKDCIVHRFVDEEFHRSTMAALNGLTAPKLNAAKEALKRGLAFLTDVRQDTKGAVTAVFEGCEIVAKHLIPEAQNLNARLCKERLLTLCMSQGASGAELDVETKVFSSMAEWVNAVHNYRHGQAEAEVVAPSLELAVQLVSMGCAFTRRLAQAYEGRPQTGSLIGDSQVGTVA